MLCDVANPAREWAVDFDASWNAHFELRFQLILIEAVLNSQLASMDISRIVDLTGDSSDAASSKENSPAKGKILTPTSRVHRHALGPVRNGVTIPSCASSPNDGLPEALEKAIDTMEIKKLRDWIKFFAKSSESGRATAKTMQDITCAFGRDVVRYHVDTDSENEKESETERSSNSEDEVVEEDKEIVVGSKDRVLVRETLRPIAVRDDELTPRVAMCLNCAQYFDVVENKRGDCKWQPRYVDALLFPKTSC
jgi:hypothetical protein